MGSTGITCGYNIGESKPNVVEGILKLQISKRSGWGAFLIRKGRTIIVALHGKLEN